MEIEMIQNKPEKETMIIEQKVFIPFNTLFAEKMD